MSGSLSKVNSTYEGIVVMFNSSGFWFKAQVEKLQGLLAKYLTKDLHCYTIFGETYSGTALFSQFIPL